MGAALLLFQQCWAMGAALLEGAAGDWSCDVMCVLSVLIDVKRAPSRYVPGCSTT
jgi:hypothetical protein